MFLDKVHVSQNGTQAPQQAHLEGVNDAILDQILVCVGGGIVAVVRARVTLQ